MRWRDNGWSIGSENIWVDDVNAKLCTKIHSVEYLGALSGYGPRVPSPLPLSFGRPKEELHSAGGANTELSKEKETHPYLMTNMTLTQFRSATKLDLLVNLR